MNLDIVDRLDIRFHPAVAGHPRGDAIFAVVIERQMFAITVGLDEAVDSRQGIFIGVDGEESACDSQPEQGSCLVIAAPLSGADVPYSVVTTDAGDDPVSGIRLVAVTQVPCSDG